MMSLQFLDLSDSAAAAFLSLAANTVGFINLSVIPFPTLDEKWIKRLIVVGFRPQIAQWPRDKVQS